MNSIVGYYSTKFGELWDQSLDTLMKEAVEGVLKETNLEKEHIEVAKACAEAISKIFPLTKEL